MRATFFLMCLGAANAFDSRESSSFLSRAGCSESLEGKYDGAFDYVCDTTVPWLHSDGFSWAAATPPEGTGCHLYVFVKGALPGCDVGGTCSVCSAPAGEVRHTVRLMGGSCEEC